MPARTYRRLEAAMITEEPSCYQRFVMLSAEAWKHESKPAYRPRPRKWEDRTGEKAAARENGHLRRQEPGHVKPTPNYYEMLGVNPDASRGQIERAYRRKAAALHPDKVYADAKQAKLAGEQLKKLNAAMQIMRDPEQRARYDKTLQRASNSSMPLTSRIKR